MFGLDFIFLIAKAIDKDNQELEQQKQKALHFIMLKEYDSAINILNYLKKIKRKDNWIYYNLACAYSLKGNQNEAINNIELAVKYGYENLEKIDNDSDLKTMRRHPLYVSFKNNGYKMNFT